MFHVLGAGAHTSAIMLQLTDDLQPIPRLLCNVPRQPWMLISFCGAEGFTAASVTKQMQSVFTYKHSAGWAACLQKLAEYQYNKLCIIQKNHLSSLLYYIWLHPIQLNSDKTQAELMDSAAWIIQGKTSVRFSQLLSSLHSHRTKI